MNPPPPPQAATEPPFKMPDVIPGAADLKDTLTKTVSSFSEPGAPGEYNFSNTIIAKFAFVIFVVIVFFYVVGLGIAVISWIFSPPANPFIVKGMIDATSGVVIPQNPENKDSVMVLRSNNKSRGVEFTYSVWLYINDLADTSKTYQHVFSKGDNQFDKSTNVAQINNAPGLYLGRSGSGNSQSVKLHVIMDTVSPTDTHDSIDITDIPLRKWVNVAIRVSNRSVDVYVNGTISGRLVLNNVPKQNYNDVYVCQNGGFAGKLSDLRYFAHALNVFEINTILNKGPNMTTSTLTADYKLGMGMGGSSSFDYLSGSWYTGKL